MPIPGLTDIYEFGDWLKREYIGTKREQLKIEPVQGGLIQVSVQKMDSIPKPKVEQVQKPRITHVFHREHDFGYCDLYDIEVPERIPVQKMDA